jgi:hypothetical protein
LEGVRFEGPGTRAPGPRDGADFRAECGPQGSRRPRPSSPVRQFHRGEVGGGRRFRPVRARFAWCAGSSLIQICGGACRRRAKSTQAARGSPANQGSARGVSLCPGAGRVWRKKSIVPVPGNGSRPNRGPRVGKTRIWLRPGFRPIGLPSVVRRDVRGAEKSIESSGTSTCEVETLDFALISATNPLCQWFDCL